VSTAAGELFHESGHKHPSSCSARCTAVWGQELMKTTRQPARFCPRPSERSGCGLGRHGASSRDTGIALVSLTGRHTLSRHRRPASSTAAHFNRRNETQRCCSLLIRCSWPDRLHDVPRGRLRQPTGASNGCTGACLSCVWGQSPVLLRAARAPTFRLVVNIQRAVVRFNFAADIFDDLHRIF
jgi:hypothetical protein